MLETSPTHQNEGPKVGSAIRKVDPVIIEDDESVFKGFKINAKGKYSENAMTDSEYKQAQQRVNTANAKEWNLLEGKDNLLIYSDKKNLNLSKSSNLHGLIKRF